jgi:hypothetical protein
MMEPSPIRTYAEFWPYYLREHQKPGTKALHILGTAIALALLIVAIASGNWQVLLAAVVAGYFFAWVGHFFVERSRPATFTYPVWSLISDFRLFFTFLAGRLDAEYRRHGLTT